MRRVITKQMPDAPHETLMTVDATTGQNGVRQAKLFGEAVGVTGIVLTKLDGTAKGGDRAGDRQRALDPGQADRDRRAAGGPPPVRRRRLRPRVADLTRGRGLGERAWVFSSRSPVSANCGLGKEGREPGGCGVLALVAESFVELLRLQVINSTKLLPTSARGATLADDPTLLTQPQFKRRGDAAATRRPPGPTPSRRSDPPRRPAPAGCTPLVELAVDRGAPDRHVRVRLAQRPQPLGRGDQADEAQPPDGVALSRSSACTALPPVASIGSATTTSAVSAWRGMDS